MAFDQLWKNKSVAERPGEKSLAAALEKLVEALTSVSEYNNRELKAISVAQTDPILRDCLSFYTLNKKHLKRKHAKEILEALKDIAAALSTVNNFSTFPVGEQQR